MARIFMRAVPHRGPCGCGRTAFYVSRAVREGDLALSSSAIMPSGEKPAPVSLIVCGHCGLPGSPQCDTYGHPVLFSTRFHREASDI